MIYYGKVKGESMPEAVKITDSNVFIAKNIESYTEELNDTIVNGFIYDYYCYTKDEYLKQIIDKNQAIEEELAAAKIILGVE